MATTFEAWPSSRRVPNYSSKPTVDVEILPDERRCETCGELVEYAPILGRWIHAGAAPDAVDKHRPQPRPRCPYCHATDTMTYTAHAYYDASTCSRCGGVDGYAIGD